MKMKIDSKWLSTVYIPARVRQFTKAAKLSGKRSFAEYRHGSVADLHTERNVVEQWVEMCNERETKQVAYEIA